jgi:ABC-type transport system involved in multi-copper enzyme maturation permease subunit
MSVPAALLAIGWLIRDTFRQALASGIFWLMLAVSILCVALCLSVAVEGDVSLADSPRDRSEALPRTDVYRASAAVAAQVAQGAYLARGIWVVPEPFYSREYQQVVIAGRHGVAVIRGRLTLAFGAIAVDIPRDRLHAVRSLQCALAGWVADAAGLLLALMWTAGFLPSFLEPSAVSVLLAKPAPRWSLLVGKYLGVLVFVAFQGLIFVAGTWFALGLRTGVWEPRYFVCLPLLVLHFAVFFSFSVLLAVSTRSAVVCAFGSVLFWLLCWGMNFGRHAALSIPDLENLGSFSTVTELAYWVMPKPLDFHLILVQALQAGDMVNEVVKVERLAERGAWAPELSVLASVLAGVVLLGMSAYEFVKADY